MATAPERVPMSLFQMVACIEIARAKGRGPAVPPELQAEYSAALSRIPELVGISARTNWDHWYCGSALSAVAAAKGFPTRTRSKTYCSASSMSSWNLRVTVVCHPEPVEASPQPHHPTPDASQNTSGVNSPPTAFQCGWRQKIASKPFASSHRIVFRNTAKECTAFSPGGSARRHFEMANRIRLPEDYRRFLSAVGNGGAEPFYGLEPLSNFGRDLSKPFPLIAATDTLTNEELDQLRDRDEYSGV
jgi:hypothetical protein